MKPEEAEKKYISLLRNLEGNRRAEIGAELYEMGRHILESSIKNQNPGISEEEFKKKLKQRMQYDSRRSY